MSDKRTVTTDALATLGTIIDDQQKRDAIHLAVEPVVAGCTLIPGWHVVIKGGVAKPAAAGKGMGIVDPFLVDPVEEGQRFWFIMYPRQVRSLRHVWSHPDFPDDIEVAKPARSKEKSEAWLREFCRTNDCPSYETTLGIIDSGNRYSHDPDFLHVDGSGAHGDIPDEFWDHVEVVTGNVYHRAKHFTCSC